MENQLEMNPMHAGFTRTFTRLVIFLAVCELSAGNVPLKVVGIFRNRICAPAIAASLAVEDQNLEIPELHFTYHHIIKEDHDNVEDDELMDIGPAVVVTGHAKHCEQALKILVNESDSYLICYNPPTPGTLELGKSTGNLYLSQPNPTALEPCLFNLVKLLIDAAKCPCPAVTLLRDRSHPYSQVENTLFSNLSSTKIRVKTVLLEDLKSFSSLAHTGSVHILIVALPQQETFHFLCKMSKYGLFGENLKLILVGSHIDSWLDVESDFDYESNITQNGDFCEKTNLSAAVEGHLFVQQPKWNVNLNQIRHLSRTRAVLLHRLAENDEHIQSDYDQASLAYDSVTAFIRGIKGSILVDGQNREYLESSLLMKKLGEPLEGLSGEFSFNHERLRTWKRATVLIKQFTNGTYTQIGRHFNANSSFYWTDLPISEVPFELGQETLKLCCFRDEFNKDTSDSTLDCGYTQDCQEAFAASSTPSPPETPGSAIPLYIPLLVVTGLLLLALGAYASVGRLCLSKARDSPGDAAVVLKMLRCNRPCRQ